MNALQLAFLGWSFWSSQLQQRLGDGYKDTRFADCGGDYGTMDLRDLTLPTQQKQSTMKEQMFRTAAGGGGHVTDTQPVSRHPVASTHFFIDWLTCSLGQLRKEGGGREKRLWTVGQGQRMTFLRKLCKDNLGEVILRDGNVCSREKRRNIIFKEAFSPPPLLFNSRDPSFHVSKSSMDPIRTLFLLWTVTFVKIDTSWLGSITKNKASIYLFRKIKQT